MFELQTTDAHSSINFHTPDISYKYKTEIKRNSEECLSKCSNESFPEAIESSIDCSNRNVQLVHKCLQEQFTEKELKDKWIKFALRNCPTPEQTITLAIVGQLNAGKSMLTRALLNNEIRLPSSDEPTTGRITRIVYSEVPVIRQIQTGSWKNFILADETFYIKDINAKYETLISDEVIEDQNLEDYIVLDEENDNEEDITKLTTIIEIGLPVDILKSGLIILDCPGLNENSKSKNILLQILRDLNPSIICYVYREDRGFSFQDVTLLDEINKELQLKLNASLLQYMLMMNKWEDYSSHFDSHEVNSSHDLKNKNIEILTFYSTITDNPNCILNTIGNNRNDRECEPCFHCNPQAFLPVIAVSIPQVQIMSDLDDDLSYEIITLQNHILSKIVNKYKLVVNFTLDYLLDANVCENKKINLWFILNSLSVEDTTVNILESGGLNSDSLISDFGEEYQIYSIQIGGIDIQITVVPNDDMGWNKNRIFNERISEFSSVSYSDSGSIYLNDEESRIYLIERMVTGKCLVDNLDDLFDRRQDCGGSIVEWLREIVNQDPHLTTLSRNFRHDTLFVDDNGSIFMNRHMPNTSNVSVINDENWFAVSNQSNSTYDDMSTLSRFIWNFGILVWILKNYLYDHDKNSPVSSSATEIVQNLETLINMCCSVDRTTHSWSVWRKILLYINNKLNNSLSVSKVSLCVYCDAFIEDYRNLVILPCTGFHFACVNCLEKRIEYEFNYCWCTRCETQSKYRWPGDKMC